MRTVLLALLLATGPGLAQPLSGTQETRYYSYGIGRITWSVPKNLEVGFAVPHFTAGPRIKCESRRYECEVQVGARDISIPDEKRAQELEEIVKPYLPVALDKKFRLLRQGTMAYTTLEDPRAGEPFKYLTVGYAQRGPSMIRFQATTNDPADTAAVLSLVQSARAEDALEMWALRFSDYEAVCAERFPAYRNNNAAALAASPFARVDLVRFFLRQDSKRTEPELRKELAAVRERFAREFDAAPAEEREPFCASLPRFIGDAAAELR
jgi:hypothetical protein